MRLKNYVLETVQEIVPIVEEKSGLECNLKITKIELTNNIFLPIIFALDNTPFWDYSGPFKKFLIYHYHLMGSFEIIADRLTLPKKFIKDNNNDNFKGFLAHELMHNAQYNSFPDLYKLFFQKEKFSSIEFKAYETLMEGDAELIRENFPIEEKIKKMPKIVLKLIGKDYYKTFMKENQTKVYEKGKEILKQKFNGNRKDINELYTAPVEDLIKIFEIKN